MNWASAVLVYVVLWWLVLFCMLPIGIRPAEEGHLGHDAGAPSNPRLGLKALITSGIAAILLLLFYLLIHSGLISLRQN